MVEMGQLYMVMRRTELHRKHPVNIERFMIDASECVVGKEVSHIESEAKRDRSTR